MKTSKMERLVTLTFLALLATGALYGATCGGTANDFTSPDGVWEMRPIADDTKVDVYILKDVRNGREYIINSRGGVQLVWDK